MSAAITQALSLGESWDFVVMQGFSLEATIALGNPTQFRADAVGILSNVRDHSPAARACLFQTWARATWARADGHSVYPSSFSGPVVMHRQIETSYAQAAADMDAAFGPDSGRRTAAGEPAFLSAFDPSLYTPDLSHPAPPMTVLASLTIFTQIYGVRACELEPDFGGTSNLAQRLASFGIGPAPWRWLAGLADRVAPAHLRRFPGSGEDYLLTSGPLGALDACPDKEVVAGGDLGLRLHSPNGLVNGSASILRLDLNPMSPRWPGHPMFPEVHFLNATSTVLMQTPALAAEGHAVTWGVPPAMAGRYALVQGYSLAPSPMTANPFTTSDAHEIRVLGAPRRREPAGPPRPGK